MLLHCTSVLYYCADLLFCISVLQYCIVQMHNITVLHYCFVLLYSNTGLTDVLYYWPVLLHCTAALYYCNVLLYCNAAMHSFTILQTGKYFSWRHWSCSGEHNFEKGDFWVNETPHQIGHAPYLKARVRMGVADALQPSATCAPGSRFPRRSIITPILRRNCSNPTTELLQNMLESIGNLWTGRKHVTEGDACGE